MEEDKDKTKFDPSGMIERTGGRNRKLRAYSPTTDEPVETDSDASVSDQLNTQEAMPAVEQPKEKPREETRRRKTKTEMQDYQSLFIHEAAIAARSGKTVYICKEHHDRIIKILHVIAKNDVSLFSYLYNVLEHHFNTYQEDITELYDNNIEKVF